MDRRFLDMAREGLGRILEDHPAVAAVYAFGSRVTGEARDGSDLDLALVLTEPDAMPDPLLAERISARLMTELRSPVEVDAHLASALPLTVRGRVLTTGVLLYEADPSARVEFETSTRRLYFDFLPLIERDAREGLLSSG